MRTLPEIIAHRGASFEAPENTLSSAKLAWQQNCDALECDVHQTLDGHLVVIHDADTKRTTGVKNIVKESTLANLDKLDAGLWKDAQFEGNKIPLLTDIVQTVPTDKRIFIEIKSGYTCLPALKNILEKSHLKSEQIVLMEFDAITVEAAKKMFAETEVIYLYEFFDSLNSSNKNTLFKEIIHTAQKLNADGINPEINPFIDKRLIDHVHNLGLNFYCWTVNDLERAKALAQAGIDGITTDRPGWLREGLQVY